MVTKMGMMRILVGSMIGAAVEALRRDQVGVSAVEIPIVNAAVVVALTGLQQEVVSTKQ